MTSRVRLLVTLFGAVGAVSFLIAVARLFLGGEGWLTHGAAALAGCSFLALLATLHGHGTGCPACGRWWSRAETKSEVGERELFERDGKTFARSLKRTGLRCEGCGHTWSVTDTDEYPVEGRSLPQRARE